MATTPVSPLEHDDEEDYEVQNFAVGEIVELVDSRKRAIVRYYGFVAGMSEDGGAVLGLEMVLDDGERGQGHNGSIRLSTTAVVLL